MKIRNLGFVMTAVTLLAPAISHARDHAEKYFHEASSFVETLRKTPLERFVECLDKNRETPRDYTRVQNVLCGQTIQGWTVPNPIKTSPYKILQCAFEIKPHAPEQKTDVTKVNLFYPSVQYKWRQGILHTFVPPLIIDRVPTGPLTLQEMYFVWHIDTKVRPKCYPEMPGVVPFHSSAPGPR